MLSAYTRSGIVLLIAAVLSLRASASSRPASSQPPPSQPSSSEPASSQPPTSEPPQGALPESPTDATARPAAKDDQEALIETWVRHAMPGEEHKLLNQMAGAWKTKVRYRMTSDTPVVESEGTCTRRWILGNRFLLEEFDGGNLGLPFQGLALYGYDAFEKKYTSAWVDTTSTAITRSLGSCQDECAQILFSGEHGDSWSGTKKKTRGVVRLVSPTEHVLELYEPDAAGHEYQVLSITYQRGETAPTPGRT